MRIDCPYCGLRDASEFFYQGDAERVRPAVGEADAEKWLAYVYERDNPKGPLKEFWLHLHGCRQVLVVERNTATHEMLSVAPARDVILARNAAAKGGS
ncbi:MAG: sarcosine oxidase subunit delta [Hyphomicrobiaceae bacterium]